MKKILYIIGVVLAMQSCVTKTYKTPELDFKADSLYRALEIKVDTTVNTGQIHWREFFTDTILKRHIDTVLAKNYDFKISIKNIEKAYASLQMSRAAFFPTLNSGTASVGFETSELTQSQFKGNLMLSATWEIDIWGKLLSAKRADIAKLQASEDGLQALQTQLVSQTAAAYYQLITFDTEIGIIEETIDVRTQYLDTMRLMKQAGRVNEVAVQQARAQLEDVRAALPQMELAALQVENAMSFLMGKTPHTIKRTDKLDFLDSKVMTDIGVPAQLLAFRPDVRAAEKNYRSAFEMYNVSRAAMYPSLSISAQGLMNNVWNAHFFALNALASLTQPIWNGRRLRTQKIVADLTAQQSAYEFQKTVLNAGQEVSNAIASQVKTRTIASAQERQLDAYQKAYDYSFQLFINGYATYLDVLTAETGVYSTQMKLLNTYYDNISARIELYRALGGGVEPTPLAMLDMKIPEDKTAIRKAKKAERKAAKEAKQK